MTWPLPHNREITGPMLVLDGQAPRRALPPPPPPWQGPAVNRSPQCGRRRRGGEGEAAQGSETPSGSPRTRGGSVRTCLPSRQYGPHSCPRLPFHHESLTGQVGRERVSRYKTGLLYSSYLHKLRQTDGHSDTCLTCSSRECCQFDLSTSRGSWESGPSSQHVKTSLLHWPNRGSRQVPSTDE